MSTVSKSCSYCKLHCRSQKWNIVLVSFFFLQLLQFYFISLYCPTDGQRPFPIHTTNSDLASGCVWTVMPSFLGQLQWPTILSLLKIGGPKQLINHTLLCSPKCTTDKNPGLSIEVHANEAASKTYSPGSKQTTFITI